jgi:hypothetical protein
MAQIPSDPRQINNVLQYIDMAESEEVKEAVFGRLGYECYTCRGLDAWVASFGGDVQAFLDRINVDQASTYWEKLVYSSDGKALVLTGREVKECSCAYAETTPPSQALCRYCCKTMQERLFGALLGKKVEVDITEAFLLGDQRCSTLIRLIEE